MRILLWLNISASKRLQCDSGLIQTIQMIEGILKRKSDYHFYLCIPDFIKPMDFEEIKAEYPILKSNNITIKYAPMTEVRRMIPYQFDFRDMEKVMNYWGADYDLVFNALPEYTNALSQALCRSTDLSWGHFGCPIVNRLHWLLAKDYVAIPDSRIEFRQVEGMLFADYNLSLCKYTENMVKDMTNTYLNAESVKKVLDKTFHLYNGIDFKKITANKVVPQNKKYKLLFPNRLQTFKNPMFMIESLVKLREKRQDFELILTDPTADFVTNNVLKNKKLIQTVKDNSDWITVKPVHGNEYYKLIYESDVVINTSDYETWCVVITEALACGKNVVVPSGLTFEEMIAPDYPYIFKRRNTKDFLDKIELAMVQSKDNTDVNVAYGKKYDWDNIIDSYINFFESIKQKYIHDVDYSTKDRDRCIEYVKSKPYVTKKEIRELLGPGEEKCWTKYRWRMLQSGIKDDYSSSEPIFYAGNKPEFNQPTTLDL